MALPTASDNPFASLLVTEGTAPASPAAGKQRVYIDSADHKVKRKDSSGTVTTVEGASGSGVITKIYLNKPAANITRAATSIGAFSTAWQVASVVVGTGQNVRLSIQAPFSKTTPGNDCLFALLRGVTQIAGWVESGSGVGVDPLHLTWIDENPGAGTYTYEVQAAMFTSGTLTVYQSNVTTDTGGGSSILTAEVYTP